MNDNAEFKKFVIAMSLTIAFVVCCLLVVFTALKPRVVYVPIEVQAVVSDPIPQIVVSPVQAPVEAAASAPAPRYSGPFQTYIVQEGDTLTYVAMVTSGKIHKYKQIAEDNNIENPDLIFPGQKLKVRA